MRNYFLTDDEDQDYDPLRDFERYESRDYSNLTQASKDPTIYLVPDTDPRQKRSGGGTSPFLTQPKEGEPGDIEAKQVGAQQQDMTEARLEAAQWGTEDADEDRLMPQDIQQKPPGPDSPSTEYKDPASKFMSRADERQKAYDEEWDASGKAKKFRIETTQQRAQRREAQQRDLYLSRREGVEAYGRSLDTKVKPYGQAMRMDGPEGDGIYQGYTDGTFKKVGGVLDKDADQKYEAGMVVTGDRWLNRMKRNSTELEPVTGPFASSDGNPFLSGAGPLAPETQVPQRKWLASDEEKIIKVGRGQDAYRYNPETGEKELVASGEDFPVTGGRGGGGSTRRRKGEIGDMNWGGIVVPGDIYGEALSSAEAEAKAEMVEVRKRDDGKSTEEDLEQWEDQLIDKKMKKKLARRGYRQKEAEGTAGPAPSGGKKVVQVNKPKRPA